MKHNIFFTALAVTLLGTAALEAGAQGIYVNKKNGETVSYPKAVFDRVVPTKASKAKETFASGVVTGLKYEKVANMKTPRIGHQIFPSGDGFVVVGGHTTDFALTTTAESFQNGKWSDLKISSPHDGAFSVVLSDGRVMVGGGFSSGAGVGQSKKVDIYDPKKNTFAAGPELSVARGFGKAIAVGKKVYVSGNWYAADEVIDYYDGKAFQSVGMMDGRSNPYLLSDKSGNVYSVSPTDPWGRVFPLTDLDNGDKALMVDKYEAATGKAKYLFYPVGDWLPLNQAVDARAEDTRYEAGGVSRFLILTSNGDNYLLIGVCPDDFSTYNFIDFNIPTRDPDTNQPITYRGSVMVNADRTECYLIGASGKATEQTVHIVSYNLAKGYWSIASASGFKYNLMEGAWTVLKDGRLACAGGNITNNYDAQKGVYLFTPPKAGAITTDEGTTYGVSVYKKDGKRDNYSEVELESITTYQEEFDERITQEIPVEYLSKMSAYMPIYAGNTPPVINGTFNMSRCEMVYNSNPNSSMKPGHLFNDNVYEFSKQDTKKNTIIFRYEYRVAGTTTVTSVAEKADSKMLGHDADFTMFCINNLKSSQNNTTSKTATIVSGTMTSEGITNCYNGLLMLEKKDPDNKLMAVGEFRIFKDQDGLAAPTTWVESANARNVTRGGADTTAAPDYLIVEPEPVRTVSHIGGDKEKPARK